MTENNSTKKFERMSQSDMPRVSLKEAVVLAEALRDNFAGKHASPINLAQSLDRSPASSSWRFLTGAAVAYGLTDAAYNASSISLTSLGSQIVKPTSEGAAQQGLMAALLRPTITKAFYEKYNGAKFPKEDIAKNILDQLGVPQDRTDEALKIVLDNAQYVGILTTIGDGQYIQLQPTSSMPVDTEVRSTLTPVTVATTLVPMPSHGGLPIETIIPNELGIAISLNLHGKARRNKKLDVKVQALYDAADAVAEEWKNQLPNSEEQSTG